MTRARRSLTTLLLAGILATGFVATARAVPVTVSPTAPSTISREQACTQLADWIKRLEGRPASPLRNALIRFAKALHAKYCTGAGTI